MHLARLSWKTAALGGAFALVGCASMQPPERRAAPFPRLETETHSVSDGAIDNVFAPRSSAKPKLSSEIVQTALTVPQEEIIDLGTPLPQTGGMAHEGGIVHEGGAPQFDAVIENGGGDCANGQCRPRGKLGGLSLRRGERGPTGEELLQQSGANITGYGPKRKLRGDMGNNPQQPRELRMSSHPLYVVEPPDILYIEALDALPEQPVAGERLVRPDGTISLGYYGQIHVAGLTLPEIEKKVRGVLEKYVQYPQVYVDVVSFNSKVFYVLGQVQNQGRLPVTGKEHVLDAIVQAGGLTTYADVNRVYLARPAPGGGCHQIFKIDYAGITECGDTRTNYQLLPGDRVFVAPTSGYRALNWMDNYITPVERVTNLFALFRFATVSQR